MSTSQIFALVLVVLILVGVFYLPFAIYRDYKKDQREAKKRKEETDRLLALEKQKPKAKLQVTTTSGRTLSREVEPDLEWDLMPGTWNGYWKVASSEKEADQEAELIMKRGYYFHEATKEHIPLCSIKSVRVLPPVEGKS